MLVTKNLCATISVGSPPAQYEWEIVSQAGCTGAPIFNLPTNGVTNGGTLCNSITYDCTNIIIKLTVFHDDCEDVILFNPTTGTSTPLTYDCTSGICLENYNGTGLYATLALCNANCSNDTCFVCSDTQTSQNVPKDLVLVLDESVSFKGEKADVLKAALNSLFADLPNNVEIKTILFNGFLQTNKATVGQYDNITNTISFINNNYIPESGTNLGKGLCKAYEEIRNTNSNGTAILVITDGAPTLAHTCLTAPGAPAMESYPDYSIPADMLPYQSMINSIKTKYPNGVIHCVAVDVNSSFDENFIIGAFGIGNYTLSSSIDLETNLLALVPILTEQVTTSCIEVPIGTPNCVPTINDCVATCGNCSEVQFVRQCNCPADQADPDQSSCNSYVAIEICIGTNGNPSCSGYSWEMYKAAAPSTTYTGGFTKVIRNDNACTNGVTTICAAIPGLFPDIINQGDELHYSVYKNGVLCDTFVENVEYCQLGTMCDGTSGTVGCNGGTDDTVFGCEDCILFASDVGSLCIPNQDINACRAACTQDACCGVTFALNGDGGDNWGTDYTDYSSGPPYPFGNSSSSNTRASALYLYKNVALSATEIVWYADFIASLVGDALEIRVIPSGTKDYHTVAFTDGLILAKTPSVGFGDSSLIILPAATPCVNPYKAYDERGFWTNDLANAGTPSSAWIYNSSTNRGFYEYAKPVPDNFCIQNYYGCDTCNYYRSATNLTPCELETGGGRVYFKLPISGSTHGAFTFGATCDIIVVGHMNPDNKFGAHPTCCDICENGSCSSSGMIVSLTKYSDCNGCTPPSANVATSCDVESGIITITNITTTDANVDISIVGPATINLNNYVGATYTSTTDIADLPNGAYTVTITDSCDSIVFNVVVNCPCDLNCSRLTASCNGTNTGELNFAICTCDTWTNGDTMDYELADNLGNIITSGSVLLATCPIQHLTLPLDTTTIHDFVFTATAPNGCQFIQSFTADFECELEVEAIELLSENVSAGTATSTLVSGTIYKYEVAISGGNLTLSDITDIQNVYNNCGTNDLFSIDFCPPPPTLCGITRFTAIKGALSNLIITPTSISINYDTAYLVPNTVHCYSLINSSVDIVTGAITDVYSVKQIVGACNNLLD